MTLRVRLFSVLLTTCLKKFHKADTYDKEIIYQIGGGCYTARVSNESVKTFNYKISLCKFEFYYDADHPNFTMFYNLL